MMDSVWCREVDEQHRTTLVEVDNNTAASPNLDDSIQ